MTKKRIVLIIAIGILLILLIAGICAFLLKDKSTSKWEILTEPTCTTEGLKQRTNADGSTETETIAALGHDSSVSKKNATCTKDGFSIHECSRCEKTFVADFTEASGHSFGQTQTIAEATCLSSGAETRTCTLCGYAEKISVRALGHSYVAISSETVEGKKQTLYKCDLCEQEITVGEGDIFPEDVANETLFDVDTNFSFDIKTDENEAFILANLKILDAYYNDSEYEDHASVLVKYTLTNKGNGLWSISPQSNYSHGTVYVAEIADGISFESYPGSVLTFSVKTDESHVNVYDYNEGIVFLNALEGTSPGYDPKLMVSSDASENCYLTLKKTDGLSIGQIICVGDAGSFDEIEVNNEYFFGKIEEIYSLDNDEWILILSEPSLEEVFSELDISVQKLIDIDLSESTSNEIKANITDSLYANDAFVVFLGAVNSATMSYLEMQNLDTATVADTKSFMDRITLKPTVSFENCILTVKVEGNINIPLKTTNKTDVGSIDVDFTVDLETTFLLSVDYELRDSGVESQKIEYLTFRVTQTNTTNFDFSIKMDVDYSLTEGLYIENTDNGKIHRRGCIHLSRVTNTSKLKSISASNAEKKIAKQPELQCKQCKPTEGFKDDIIVVNTSTKAIHAYDCIYVAQMAAKNKQTSDENATYWMKQGYTCCDWCHPESRDQRIYEKLLAESLEYSDWQQVATDIAQWAKEAGIEERSKKGVDLFPTITIPIAGPIQVSFNCQFVLTLKIEASLSYEYSHTQVNEYGLRFSHSGVVPFSAKKSEASKNTLSVMGEIEIKAGLLLDFNINICGLDRWACVGLTAEIGAYANLNGVMSTFGEEYRAAYFEAGIYADISLYYKLLFYDDGTSILSSKIPIVRLGYGKAYFDYVDIKDSINIHGSCDLSTILKVKYFDLRSMTTLEGTLNPLGRQDVYTVNYSFEKGEKFAVVDGKIVALEDITCQDVDTLTITVVGHSEWDNYEQNSAVFYLKEYTIKLTAVNMHDYVDGVCLTCGLKLENDGEHVCIPVPIGERVEATCQETGLTEGSVCLICDKILEKRKEIRVNSNNHVGEVDSSIILPATCKTDGYKIDIYSGCGHEVKHMYSTHDYHNHVEYSIDKSGNITEKSLLVEVETPRAASCTDIGWSVNQICSACQKTVYKEIPAGGHDLVGGKCKNCNETFAASQGLEFASNGDGTCYVKGIGNCTDINLVIPEYAPNGEKVVAIGSNAFYNLYGKHTFTSLIIPGTVQSIGEDAFYMCSKLTRVSIGTGVSSIGEFAFYECKNIKSITIPGTVKTIGTLAFSYSQMTSAKLCEGVEAFNGAFYKCSKLKIITIPGTVTEITDEAFVWCSNLQYVTIGEGVTRIGEKAFNNTALIDVIIPDSVKEIGCRAFEYCDDLRSVIIGDGVETIGQQAFFECTNISDLTMGKNVKTIEGEAFRRCYNLENVVLPDTLETIEYWAFLDCGLTSIVIPNSVKEMGNSVFQDTPLETAVLGNGLTAIPDDAFRECELLREINIPEEITSIGADAFYGCKSLMSIDLPEGITTIGKWAFAHCVGFTSFDIPDRVTKIELGTFAGCKNLTSLKIPYGVMYIGESAFAYCELLESIELPEELTEIGSYAFQYCYALNDVQLPSGVKKIGAHAFAGCKALTSIYIPEGVTEIAGHMFYSCESLSSITLAGDVTEIGEYAFAACYSLKSIKLPKTVTEIGRYAFAWCDNLENVEIPNSVTEIGSYAFSGCNKFVDIVLPDKLTYISSDCFGSNVSTIVIPTSVTRIGYDAITFNKDSASIFYCGSTYQWDGVDVYNADDLKPAVVYFYSETKPTSSGNYWHYVDGVPTIWQG